MQKIYLHGTVGLEITAMQVRRELEAAGNEPVTAVINSPGGDVNEGIAIYEMLLERGVNTQVSGVAASMGSVIFMAGKEREITPNSRLMIHNPWQDMTGDAEALRKAGETLAKVEKQLEGLYVERTGIELAKVDEYMKNETWLNADEAVQLGFATKVYDLQNKAVAYYKPESMSKSTSLVDRVKNLIKGQTEQPETPQAREYTLDNGVVIDNGVDAEIEVGQTITAAGEPVGAGTHTLQDGIMFVTDEDSVVTEVMTEPEGANKDDDMEGLKAENDELKAKVEAMSAELEQVNALVAEFEARAAKTTKTPQGGANRTPQAVTKQPEGKAANRIVAADQKREQYRKNNKRALKD